MDTLASPVDRRASNETYNVGAKYTPSLTDEESAEAFADLKKDMPYIRVDRRYADPPIADQKIVLVSFVPSKTAVPDKDNIYGMMKVRGVFATEQEANDYSENLIRNVDSLHEIYHAWVGRPFPVTTATGFEKELKTIDIRKKTIDLISDDILSRRREDEKELKEIQEKEKRLLDESKKAREDLPADPFDQYITEQVKRAQIIWTYRETKKKMDQMKDIVQSSNEAIAKMEAENPDFIHQYREKYMKARRDAGIPDDDESFIRYLGQDHVEELDV